MAFWFTGFFARPGVPRPEVLSPGAVWRDIATPFIGVGVRLAGSDDTQSPAEVEALARRLGLDGAESWVFLKYTCWGGRIDSVDGLGSCGGVPFDPISEDDDAENAYLDLMRQFGIPTETALRFEPFHRGYWGEK